MGSGRRERRWHGAMMAPDGLTRVDIIVPAGTIRRFSTLLAHGFTVDVPSGITVYELLTGCLGIDPGIFEKQSQTLLHEGRPVDDAVAHRVTAPSSIALSGALPGLFGAAFRKQGRFAPMRHLPVCPGNQSETEAGQIGITVKLFNTAAEAIGTDLLERGVRISVEVFVDFWKRHLDDAPSPEIKIRIDGTDVATADVADRLCSGGGEMFLTVSS